ncbi:MAG TPA: hypothetical protein VKR24_00650 [Candidatus Limnocylindrales bacterium]|nr:hypothetical protein [Candidatus Limnocylindrales bacterium]
MTSNPRSGALRLTFPQLWVALAILLPVLASLLATMSAVDLAYHVRAGELILDQGALLRTDPFAFTTGGASWLDQQWGSQVLLAIGYRLDGWAGLAVLRAVLVALVIGLVFIACRRSGVGLRVAAWLALGGFILSAAALGLRPQLLGMVLFAATLAILAGRERRTGRAAWLVWLIPVLVIPWASIHGSFIFAPVAVGVAWLEDELNARRGAHQLLAVAITSVLASLINPFGIGVWSYAIGLTTNPTIRRLITEWQPTTPLSVDGVLLYGSMIVFGILIVRRVRDGGSAVPRAQLWRQLGPALLWLLFLGVVAIIAERGIAWWALAAPVAIAGVLGRPLPVASPASDPRAARVERPSVLNGAIVVVLALVGVLLLPVWRGGTALQGPAGLLTDAPAGITSALMARVGPTDRIWNAQAWGSWFEFALPGVPIAVDSRIEVIPTAAWDDHIALSGGAPDWEAILDRWKVTVVVASRSEQAALIPLISASPLWTKAYADADGFVFVRR